MTHDPLLTAYVAGVILTTIGLMWYALKDSSVEHLQSMSLGDWFGGVLQTLGALCLALLWPLLAVLVGIALVPWLLFKLVRR